MKKYDAFICHATEDKDALARPLASLLAALGFNIWYDEFSLKPGQSLRGAIDHGISRSKYGIVILSPAFFKKHWTKYELDGLMGTQLRTGQDVVLPVWHKVSAEDVAKYSPSLATKVAIKSEYGVEEIARKILETIGSSRKWNEPRRESGIVRLGFAGAGSQVFLSRNFKIISIWRNAENTDLLDGYSGHPLYKKNPHLGAGARSKDIDEELTHLVDLPESTAWYVVFYRLDFPPLQKCPFSEEVLRRIDAGETFSIPMNATTVELFHAGALPSPTMMALFTIHAQDGGLSVIVAVGPG